MFGNNITRDPEENATGEHVMEKSIGGRAEQHQTRPGRSSGARHLSVSHRGRATGAGASQMAQCGAVRRSAVLGADEVRLRQRCFRAGSGRSGRRLGKQAWSHRC